MITPQNVVLTVNRACNNRCFGCYAKETEYSKKEMEIETAKKLIDICRDLKISDVSFLGGEPTMYSKLIEVIEYAANSGINPLITTNGRRFSNYNFTKRIYESGLKGVALSMKGYNRKNYIMAGGVDGYYEAIQGLINLQKFEIPTTISTVIFNKDLRLMKNFILNMVKKGFKSYVFSTPSPIILGNKVNTKDMLSPKESAECIMSLYPFLENLGIQYKILAMMPACLLKKLPLTDMYENDKINFRCPILNGSSLFLGIEGEVFPCNHIFNYPLGKMGDNYNDTEEFKSFWNSGNAEKYRKVIQKYPSLKCIDCELWRICGGGCLLKNMAYPPDECITGMRDNETIIIK